MIILLIVLDQLAKYFAYNIQPSFDVLGDFFRIQYIQNTGTIFGWFENSNLIFLILAILLCAFLSIYMHYHVEKKSAKEKAFMLIMAGGIGNIIDRIVRGFVVDFLSLKWVGIFNFSDAYIVIGICILLFLEFKEWKLKNDLKK